MLIKWRFDSLSSRLWPWPSRNSVGEYATSSLIQPCFTPRLFAYDLHSLDNPDYYRYRKEPARAHAYHTSDIDLDDVMAAPFGSQPSVYTTDKSQVDDGDTDSLNYYR